MELVLFLAPLVAVYLAFVAGSALVFVLGLVLGAEHGRRAGIRGLKISAWIVVVVAVIVGILWLIGRWWLFAAAPETAFAG